MTRSVWRIATDTPDYEAHNLSGAGARRTGGRWNSPGEPLVYASETPALACLETMVHLNAAGLPLKRYLVEITVPDDIWRAGEVHDPASLPVGWDAQPAGRASLAFGAAWGAAMRSLILLVPSTIVPEERNVLVNTLHPDCARLAARKIRKWLYDPRLVPH